MSLSPPRIELIPTFRLLGLRQAMSFATDQTPRLWRQFMARRAEIRGRIGKEFYSARVFPSADFFQRFDPKREFENWAAVRVEPEAEIPAGMEELALPAGQFAVFGYQGHSQEAPAAFQHIYGTWLPQSGFVLDDRPHFAVMGEKYRNEDPNSEEEFWIPVREWEKV